MRPSYGSNNLSHTAMPTTSMTTNTPKKINTNTLAFSTASAPMPANPKIAAINAMTKKMMSQLGIDTNFISQAPSPLYAWLPTVQ